MKESVFELGTEADLQDLLEICSFGRKVAMTPATRKKLSGARKALHDFLAKSEAVYGINTGFGDLASHRIPREQCKTLQVNLIRSHACGVGEPMPAEQARGIMFLRANEMAKGHSGVRPEVVDVLVQCINKDVIPFVPTRGSVGASGDLAPSAHVALMLIGEGKARYKNSGWLPSAEVLEKAGIKPIELEEKEGLALINGTQAMQSVGGLALMDALKVWHAATTASAMTLEALKGTPAPFRAEIHYLKPHAGQLETAQFLNELLEDSEIRKTHLTNDTRVQDPYSLRCIPQVHGAVRDALEYALDTVETEMTSVTDNPLLIWNEKSPNFAGLEIISGGNFHGMPLSIAYDSACAAMTALGNISERRIFQLISDPTHILPPFLTKNSGLESGFMIAQYAAASIASENKTLAHPACADSIPTSANKEDFVSMGMWAAIKLGMVAKNTAAITAIELIAAAHGLDMHKPLKGGKGVERARALVRKLVPEIHGDTSLAEPIETVRQAILDGQFVII